jgi:hypothetical protein
VRLLCFQAKRFAWRTFEKTLETAQSEDVAHSVTDAVVAFVHVEVSDVQPERQASVARQALKHLKWLANKRGLHAIVLHSFAHLGGDGAAPAAAQDVLQGLADRLSSTGYSTWVTPFGYSNAWELEVFGEGSAKVWKQI